MTIHHIAKFFNEIHNIQPFSFPEITEDSMQLQDDMRTLYTMQIQENLFLEKQYAGGAIGVSQLGKPAICTAWDYFYGKETRDEVPWSMKRKWLGGHSFELWVYYLLRRMNYEVEHQAEVNVCDSISHGHPDFVVTSPYDGSTFVLECKHMKDSNFKQYKKKGMYNEQYITQLALYCYACQCEGAWIIGNTDTGECLCLPFTDLHKKANENYVVRAMKIAGVVQSSENFASCLQYIKLPPHLKTKDGRFYPPPTMYIGSGRLHPAAYLWNIEVTDDGKYSITGYNYPNEAKQFQPTWEA